MDRNTLYWFRLVQLLLGPIVRSTSRKIAEAMVDGYDIYGALSAAQVRSEAGEKLADSIRAYIFNGYDHPGELATMVEEYDKS